MKRGQGQVTGQGGLERDLGRGPIADFADGDDLGILAQQGAQAALESQARRQVDLGLGHARDGGLDGVFQRGQAALAPRPGGQLAQAGIKGRRLAATGRTGQDACA